MNFNLAVIGFGVIGTETLDTIHKQLKILLVKKSLKLQ